MSRYKKFGITIHPLDESDFNWDNKSKTGITVKFRLVDFLRFIKVNERNHRQ